MNPFEGVKLDANGHIVPTDEAMVKVERDYGARSRAERYRLAQAQTLIDAFKRHQHRQTPV